MVLKKGKVCESCTDTINLCIHHHTVYLQGRLKYAVETLFLETTLACPPHVWASVFVVSLKARACGVHMTNLSRSAFNRSNPDMTYCLLTSVFVTTLSKPQGGGCWWQAQYWENILFLLTVISRPVLSLFLLSSLIDTLMLTDFLVFRVSALGCGSLWWCCYEEWPSGTNQLLVVWLFNSSHVYCLKGILYHHRSQEGLVQCSRWWRMTHTYSTVWMACVDFTCALMLMLRLVFTEVWLSQGETSEFKINQGQS